MAGRIIVLSGPIASGKTTLGDMLVERYSFVRFKTNELIQTLRPRVANERTALQKAGESLDRTTRGAWVRDALIRKLTEFPDNASVVVDSVRIANQISEIRQSFGSIVYHIHLNASDSELAQRYSNRKEKIAELPTYSDVKSSRTERNVGRLANLADIVVETDRCTGEDVLIRAVAHLGLYARNLAPTVDVIVGGQYGSEGKGNIAAHIAPEYSYLVRVGGPNAGHKVFGEPVETYHHLPSGTSRATNAKLILGPGAILNIDGLLDEISRFAVTSDRLFIDPQAMVITKEDIQNERKRLKKISSTAQGVGEASARKINDRGRVLRGKSQVTLSRDVPELRPFIEKTAPILEAAYRDHEKILLEGTQGTSLSLHHGDYPYVTSRDTTVSGCLADAGISPKRIRRIVMVCRTYPIRVGGPSGPMSQGREIDAETIAKRSGLALDEIEKTERTTTTNRKRRIAEFDWSQLRRSTMLNGPTDIALTFVDYLDAENQKARRFEQLTIPTINFIEEVERVSGVPISLISTRFDYRNIIDRRAW